MFELTLGTLLTVGLWTRVCAVLAAGMMAYAYFFEHLPVHWEPMQNGGAFAATFCWGFLLLALAADDTRLSLDRVRAQRAGD